MLLAGAPKPVLEVDKGMYTHNQTTDGPTKTENTGLKLHMSVTCLCT